MNGLFDVNQSNRLQCVDTLSDLFTDICKPHSDCSQSELDRDCLEKDCLPTGNLCSHLAIKSDCLEVEGVVYLWAVSWSLQLLAVGHKTKQ